MPYDNLTPGDAWQVAGQTISIQPVITTSGTTHIYYPPPGLPVASPAPSREPSPTEWLRSQVNEVCEMARAA